MKGVIGDVVKSDIPGSSIKHFVTPKRSSELNQEFVELKADGIDALTFSEFFEWEGGLPGTSAEKRKARRDATDVFKIKIKRKQGGAVVAEMHVWVIWCTVTARPGIAQFIELPADGASVFKVFPNADFSWRFIFAIEPISIITASEKPALKGENKNPAPGASTPEESKPYYTQPDLGDGDTAILKWDVSRQMQETVLNPDLIPKTDLLAADSVVARYRNQPKLEDKPIVFPTRDYEGNDDAILGENLTDEDANPYVARVQPGDPLAHQIGEISSSDNPNTTVFNSWGVDQRKFGVKANFREFARVEIDDGEKEGKTDQFWYRISDYKLWHHSLSAEFKASSSRWENAGSSSGVGLAPKNII
jgi:hypothetical protein